MRGEKDGRAPCRTWSRRISFVGRAPDGIDSFKRLVHQEQFAADESGKAAMATRFRIPLRVFPDQFSAVAADSKSSINSLARSRAGTQKQAMHAADELDELGSGEMVEQQRFIGHEADTGFEMTSSPGRVSPRIRWSPKLGEQSHQHPDRGCCAGAIWAEEAKKQPHAGPGSQAINRGLCPIHLSAVRERQSHHDASVMTSLWYKLRLLRNFQCYVTVTPLAALKCTRSLKGPMSAGRFGNDKGGRTYRNARGAPTLSPTGTDPNTGTEQGIKNRGYPPYDRRPKNTAADWGRSAAGSDEPEPAHGSRSLGKHRLETTRQGSGERARSNEMANSDGDF